MHGRVDAEPRQDFGVAPAAASLVAGWGHMQSIFYLVGVVVVVVVLLRLTGVA